MFDYFYSLQNDLVIARKRYNSQMVETNQAETDLKHEVSYLKLKISFDFIDYNVKKNLIFFTIFVITYLFFSHIPFLFLKFS